MSFRTIALRVLTIMAGFMAAISCSTVKVLPEGSYRLKENQISILNHDKYPEYKSSDLNPYIRQKPNSYFIGNWNPFLYVYNWSNGSNSRWDNFVKKVGVAPVVYDPDLVESSLQNIETHLEYLGYYNSIVTDSLNIDGRIATSHYSITLGKQYPIKEIKYSIRDSSICSTYLADTTNSLIKVGVPLSEKILEDESQRAVSLFKEMGYYGFSKNYFFFTADTLETKDSTSLEVRIENYTRNESEANAKPHRKYYIRDVNIYPVSNLLKYRASLSSDIPLQLDTTKYGEITILSDGELNISPSTLLKMNLVEPNSLYSESIINTTYRRFSSLKLFNSINLSLDQVSQDSIDCNIRLIPSKSQGYKINLESSINSNVLMGISPQISYYNRNIFHGGEWLNLSFMGNFQFSLKNHSIRSNEFGTSLGLSLPNLIFFKGEFFKTIVPRTDLSLSYNYQTRPEYTRNLITAQFGYSWNSTNNKRFYKITPLRANIIKMSNMSHSFYEKIQNPFVKDSYKNQFNLGGAYSFSYLNSNFKANLQVDIAGNALVILNRILPKDSTGARAIWGLPYSQYFKTEASVSNSWHFGKENRTAVAARFLAGAGFAYGNSTSLPFERLFWAGGPNSLRGWQTRSVGPGISPIDTTFSIPNQNGDMRFEANIELRFPLVWKLNGAIFLDVGNVWLKHDISSFNNFLQGIALNTGYGIRLDLQVLVLRLDSGVILRDPSDLETPWRRFNEIFTHFFRRSSFQFSIGYPF